MWSRLKSPDAIEHALLLPILFHCVDASGRPLLDAPRRSLLRILVYAASALLPSSGSYPKFGASQRSASLNVNPLRCA